ncbi:exopolygalacturonase-like [Humulus lupulus]|uniref:exopolygalacturonase-like n=1 Tax=Humulus lupulus TaxID=3486 RepID=UPI002B40C872|nr:exopolygalacturonase-like [Humulus lupulus]
MGLQRNKNVLLISLVVLVAISVVTTTNCQTFDVTKYGAKPDGPIDQALVDAWKEACATPAKAKIIVPKGTYKLSKAFFLGPCKSPVEFQLDGILMAPAAASGFKSGDGWVTFERIQHLTVSGTGTFDGNGKDSWGAKCKRTDYCAQLPINLRLNYVTDSEFKDFTSKDSKQFHITVLGGENLSFKNLKITAPEDSWTTDGIHLGRSTNITISDCTITTGDDCISIGDGTKKLTVTKVSCGPGHGISVGSLGKYKNELPVEGVTVTDCTFKGTSNGVRVKTWEGSPEGIATDLHFEKLTMENVENPIIIDQEYCPWGSCSDVKGSKIKVSKVTFKDIKGTASTPFAYKLVCGLYPCENVQLMNINLQSTGAKIAGKATSVCKNVKPQISGTINPPPCIDSAA